jgi:hypothetical protein
MDYVRTYFLIYGIENMCLTTKYFIAHHSFPFKGKSYYSAMIKNFMIYLRKYLLTYHRELSLA